MMRLFAVALIAATACRGDQPPAPAGSGSGSGSSSSPGAAQISPGDLLVVPDLPATADGSGALSDLDKRVSQFRDDPAHAAEAVGALHDRAVARGNLDDYLAAIAIAKAWTDRAANDPAAWATYERALASAHRFAAARALLDKLDPTVRDAERRFLDDATAADLGHAPAGAERLVARAIGLARAGNYAEALALLPVSVAAMTSIAPGDGAGATPQLAAWFLYQWGRVLELQGNFAGARKFYEASRARMDTVEATVHLIAVMRTAGDRAGADALAKAAVAANPHPDLLAAAGRIDDAKQAWDKYVAALPEAFSARAARFYLGPGRDPARALALARANLAFGASAEASALLVEAALAAGDPKTACDAAGKLAGPANARADRELALRAYSACGATHADDASQLANELKDLKWRTSTP